jgi:hypothetical protein
MKRQRVLFAICGIVMIVIAALGIAVGIESYKYHLQLVAAGNQGSENISVSIGYIVAVYYALLAIPGIGAVAAAFKVTKTRLIVSTVFLVLLWAFWFTTAAWSWTQLRFMLFDPAWLVLCVIQATLIVIPPVLTYCVASCKKELKRTQQADNTASPQ